MKPQLFKARRRSVCYLLLKTIPVALATTKIARNLLISNIVSVFAVRVGMWQVDSLLKNF